ncbi:MAG: low temperature requirement protein A [Actinomycetes bacterium]
MLREGQRVKPLELFFDLVFVLAITQCTALMVEHPTWRGVAEGVVVLALLWWSWVGYAWLTSVLDPEEGGVRIALFAAMAGLLLAALAVPGAFADSGLEFALAYGLVRVGQIVLFVLASRDDAALRQSVGGLAVGTAIGVGLVIGGSFLDAGWQLAVWGLALALDMAEPYFFGADGWRLVPGHFAERHWLIVIVALGESIVALGVGAEVGLDLGVAAAAVLGVALVSALWWLYFDVVAILGAQRLVNAAEGRERNELARDVYSYMHFLLVAGIVLAAVGLHETLAHVADPLHTVPAFALLGGIAVYLVGHVAVRWRHVRTLNRQRAVVAALLLACVPLATRVPSLVTLATVTALLCLVIVYETMSYGEDRARVRRSFESQTD